MDGFEESYGQIIKKIPKEYRSIQVLYSSIQVFKYASMQVCKFASMQVFKYLSKVHKFIRFIFWNLSVSQNE